MTRFKYYTIYRCRNCGERIRVHGKLTSKLVLPPGIRMCCDHPRLKREKQILISEYDAKTEDERREEREAPSQRSLTDFGED
ncbi:MAG: hypothetical protein ACFFDP_13540 [Promethearchaeota archaeon]